MGNLAPAKVIVEMEYWERNSLKAGAVGLRSQGNASMVLPQEISFCIVSMTPPV